MGSGGEICVSHTSVCRQSIWGPPEALFLYWRQGKCLLGPKCQPPVHKNPAMAVLNGLAAKPFRHGRGWFLYGQYHRVLTVHRNALKRVRSVPPGTQHTQKRIETCAVSTKGRLACSKWTQDLSLLQREYEVACGISPFFFYICETHKKS